MAGGFFVAVPTGCSRGSDLHDMGTASVLMPCVSVAAVKSLGMGVSAVAYSRAVACVAHGCIPYLGVG